MRPSINIDIERREKLILGIAAGVTAIYRYFAPQRMEAKLAAEGTAYRQADSEKSDATVFDLSIQEEIQTPSVERPMSGVRKR